MTTEPTDKQKEEAREIVDGARKRFTDLRFYGEMENHIAAALSSRDTEIRNVLEGLGVNVADRGMCWCWRRDGRHSTACLAAQALWNKVKE